MASSDLPLQNPKLLKSKLYINGEWLAAGERRSYPVRNPANGEVISNVADGGKAETVTAIAAAAKAFPAYAALAAAERAAKLYRWHGLIMANQEDLAIILTAEMGKPLAEARAEISYGASFASWFAGEAERISGATLPTIQDRRLFVLKQPVGVCAAITPWNFPLAMITRKVAPALAAGCTIVVKPAAETPLTALALAELATQAGFPAGAINIVCSQRAAEVGLALTSDPVVRKLTFTGSTEIGRLLYANCAPDIKRLSLELGGNAPFIVFDDADLEAAVAGTIISKFRNTGQTCVCANRIYAHDKIYDRYASMLTAAVRMLKVGDGMKAGTEQGPLINAAGLAKVEEHVADALNNGATVLCGGGRHRRGGLFYQPTVLANVSSSMKLNREETFGPVAALIRFTEEQEVLSMVNDTPFGLAAYFYTKDLARAHRFADGIEAGMVGINTGLVSSTAGPFGGVKQSGLGREGSKYGIDEFLEIKLVCMGGTGTGK